MCYDFLMKPVIIEWLDSRGVTSSWEFKDDLDPLPPVRIQSIGFLVDDHKDYKTLVQNISEEQIAGRITIPKGCIVKIKKVR